MSFINSTCFFQIIRCVWLWTWMIFITSLIHSTFHVFNQFTTIPYIENKMRYESQMLLLKMRSIWYYLYTWPLNGNVLLYDSIFLLLFIFGLWVTKIYDSNDKILFIALSIHSQNEQIKIISYWRFMAEFSINRISSPKISFNFITFIITKNANLSTYHV